MKKLLTIDAGYNSLFLWEIWKFGIMAIPYIKVKKKDFIITPESKNICVD